MDSMRNTNPRLNHVPLYSYRRNEKILVSNNAVSKDKMSESLISVESRKSPFGRSRLLQLSDVSPSVIMKVPGLPKQSTNRFEVQMKEM